MPISAMSRAGQALEMQFEPSLGISAKKLQKFGLDIRSFHEPLKRAVQQVVIPSIRTNFDEGGRPPWEQLSEDTIRQKGTAGSILVRTGALRRTMGYFNIWTVNRQMAYLADLPANVWYGKVHQAGATFTPRQESSHVAALSYRGTSVGGGGAAGGGGVIPARPFVMLQPGDFEAIERVFYEWLGERMVRAGFL